MTEAERAIEESKEELANDELVKLNDDGTRTVTLGTPVEYNNSQVEALTFRKPKGRDWMAVDNVSGDIAKSVAIACRICSYPKKVFEEMEEDDFLRCLNVTNIMGKK